MDQIEQDFARFKQPAVALAGGIAVALVVATLPHVYLENIVGATGLSEIIPAAAPPLGNTARGLIATVAGLISASALYLLLNHKTKSHEGGSDMGLAIRNNLTTESLEDEREERSRFTVPKLNLSARSLTKFLKKPRKSSGEVTELKDLPDTRTADRHPDAPARQPIFASSDLGAPLAEKIKRFDETVAQEDITETEEPAKQSAGMRDPLSSKKMAPSQSEERPVQNRTEPVARPVEAVSPKPDLSALSLDQLADRLEAGLERLEALQKSEPAAKAQASPEKVPDADHMASLPDAPQAEAPVAMPPLRSVDPVETGGQTNRQADMDAALKAALGTLERMTVQR